MKDLVCLLGILLVVEGIPYFISPKGMKRLMEEIPKLADSTLRLAGFVAMILGVALVYMGRS
jgi:hypothetical protein